jgi:hypothetical protein
MELETRIKIASSGYLVAATMSLAGLVSPSPWVRQGLMIL